MEDPLGVLGTVEPHSPLTRMGADGSGRGELSYLSDAALLGRHLRVREHLLQDKFKSSC